MEKTAAQVKVGKVPTLAALDTQIGQAARADLDRRWLVSDVTTWYPVVEEPHRHLVAAMEAYGKKDYKAAAAEVHKAAAYVRLEAASSGGDTRVALLSLSADLDKVGRDIERAPSRTRNGWRTSSAASNTLWLFLTAPRRLKPGGVRPTMKRVTS